MSTTRQPPKPGWKRATRIAGSVPGALMIYPLFLGAVVNTFFPQVLDVGSFTSDLFRDGTGALLGLFFFCMGAQIDFRQGFVTIEKGVTVFTAKVGIGVAIGLGVAFLTPDGSLIGLTPLALIAAITNSNSALFVALTKQFGNLSDRGSVSILSINDGPFITLIALGAAGLVDFPLEMLVGLLLPLAAGFVIGNASNTARTFLRPGEALLIPFLGFVVGRGIDFSTLGQAGLQGILLGLITLTVVGAGSMALLYLLHLIRRRPPRARNLIAGAAESTTAGNAIATPAAVALVDPSYEAIQSVATAQVAAATITTALLVPFLVALVSRWQLRRGVSPEAEDEWNFHHSPKTELNEPRRTPDPQRRSNT
ncbi:2-keto-3-deoxygluconate permease [Sediminivirga luteola]|uniref:2-keto-3-deoxygluconate permease 1 n=1 Tax=Sediminivirga luteola TaxID=1774748 RepID=A0A8J2TV96_9MICO|nr:2-keto-3-deoxygluconate permease [Sediminivirga luteola]MCI2264630.1 2-keto-3-deoxygluconate permease [Sediminivirga luteola]GGA02882.1 2-keto-3-deoxygluconate permease 1 [Sediminivirga luteola]